jgi:hypothetical protein
MKASNVSRAASYDASTYALAIHIGRQCLVHAGILFIIYYSSMFVTVCYFNAVEIFIWAKERGGGVVRRFSFTVYSSLHIGQHCDQKTAIGHLQKTPGIIWSFYRNWTSLEYIEDSNIFT